ncbi:toll/interleukin-1 receptor domain-containing protein [Gallionella capsiferriformans]|uniref:TIR protein n=1 Tax=Gallionella capsiferriformans (strain ES-2) TaxID=395494 RepID=D9SFF3_GALCS|nr:toll/interleukin-1 receptor domain-containing protein [Gallionella capsiferriformans]ADL55250.1 TIR protein [Gallionella capsiferriformans ES-2]
MADVFISHSQVDLPLAEFLHRHLTQEGLEVYLASVSMQPGERWMPHIMESLRSSTWVLCLASRTACASPWVMQEMGAAIVGNKKLIPIIWDQPAEALPGWMKQFQAVNLAGASQQDAVAAFGRIAETIKSEKQKGLVILGLLVAGLVAFGK